MLVSTCIICRYFVLGSTIMGYRTARGTHQESNHMIDSNYDERLSNGEVTLTIKYDVLDSTVQVEQAFNDNYTTMVMTNTQWTQFRQRCVSSGYTVVEE